MIGTTGRTVKNYESPGGTSPRATELCALDEFGMDILYIITGIRAPLRSRLAARGSGDSTPENRPRLRLRLRLRRPGVTVTARRARALRPPQFRYIPR